MLANKKPIGGMLMAAVLLMGMLSPSGFREVAGQVTVNEDVLSQKNVCRLFVNGQEKELKPGIYHNAMLLVEGHYARAEQETRIGKVDAAEEQYLGLYVDA